MKPTRLLLADDHTLVRAGLRALLEEIAGVQVVAEADDGEQAVALALALRPEVALLDISMPRLSGLQAAARIRVAAPEVRIVMLSMHAEQRYVTQALSVGAAGYLAKSAAAQELPLALQAVCAGRSYLSPQLAQQADHIDDERQSLTPRQQEVLRQLALGNSVKEIAFRLDLSSKTIETYRAQLMERLDIHDLASLVRYAIRTGIVSAES